MKLPWASASRRGGRAWTRAPARRRRFRTALARRRAALPGSLRERRLDRARARLPRARRGDAPRCSRSRGLLIAAAFWLARRGLGPRTFFGLVLAVSFLEELLAGSLVVFSRPPGAFALAPLPLLRALFHAITFGAGPQLPHLALAHGFGLLAALALRPRWSTPGSSGSSCRRW